jgi:hypothetical protein
MLCAFHDTKEPFCICIYDRGPQSRFQLTLDMGARPTIEVSKVVWHTYIQSCLQISPPKVQNHTLTPSGTKVRPGI